jgi:hypothetical protein
MSDGSRWYFPVYEGLFAAEHCEQMGPSLWLYGWIVARAHIAQTGGVIKYNHLTAANDLGKSERTIRLWFQTLQEYGYLITRARHQYHLEVEVTKWRAVEEWWNARRNAPDGQLLAGLKGKEGQTGNQNGNENGNQNGNILPPSPIYITLSHYEYPSGSGEPARHSLADAFRELLEQLKTIEAKNRPVLLAQIYRLCFGEADVPSYGYLGKIAKEVGGAGRLAELMWQATAKPPTGDVLAYLRNTAKGQAKRNGKGPAAQVETDPEFWAAEEKRVRAMRGD